MVVEGSPAPLFEAGSKFRGFRIVKVEEIPDVRATAYLIEHEAKRVLESFICTPMTRRTFFRGVSDASPRFDGRRPYSRAFGAGRV